MGAPAMKRPIDAEFILVTLRLADADGLDVTVSSIAPVVSTRTPRLAED
jgi:hypothetical protein